MTQPKESEMPVFLTDGITFIGPYQIGTFDIPRGERTLREIHGASEVYAVRAETLEAAKRTFRK